MVAVSVLWSRELIFNIVYMEVGVYSVSKWDTGRARSESDGTRWRTGGEVKGKEANGVGSQ